MLLDIATTTTTFTPGAFALGSAGPTTGPTAVPVPGATLLVAPQVIPAAADAAIGALRTAGVKGRRVAWCHAGALGRSATPELRNWGRRLVEEGRAEMVVASGAGSREVAAGARGAGLQPGRAIACRNEATARNVLGDSLADGDVLLTLGLAAEACQLLVDRLESRNQTSPRTGK